MKKNKIKKLITSILLPIFVSFIAHADFTVKTTKQVNINNEQKVTARIEGKKQMMEGFIKITPVDNKFKLDISWTILLSAGAKTNITSLLTSEITIDKNILPKGTILFVRGNISSQIDIEKKDGEKKEEKKRDLPSNGGKTNVSFGGSGYDNPVKEEKPQDLQKIVPITTLEGCHHLYDTTKETIQTYQRVYYFDNEGNKIVKEDCHYAKTVAADKEQCEFLHDYVAKVTYQRMQPTFSEEGKKYTAGGCIPVQSYAHILEFSTCTAVGVNGTFVKQGQWYYQNQSGEKIFISDCVLDPKAESNDLLIKYDGCPVTHNVDQNQSMHTGRYYWVKPDSTVEFIGDCVETSKSYFPHKIQFTGDISYNNQQGYSQKKMKRLIEIATENRVVIIDDKELDIVKYQHEQEFKYWVNHDDTRAHGKEGHSNKFKAMIVFVDGQKYYTGVEFEDTNDRANHKYSHFDSRKVGKCGGYWSGNKYAIKEWYTRPDLSKYAQGEYDDC